MNALPSFLESALVSLQEMIEKWESVRSQITNEQLVTLKHGCNLLKETYQEVETHRKAAGSISPDVEEGRVYSLRGQRVHYDRSTARSDQRRKRRRTAEILTVGADALISDEQAANRMLGSPESIEDNRSPEQEEIQDNFSAIHEQSPIELTRVSSPATSIGLDGHLVEQESLFIPEEGDAYHNSHNPYNTEAGSRIDRDSNHGVSLRNTYGEDNIDNRTQTSRLSDSDWISGQPSDDPQGLQPIIPSASQPGDGSFDIFVQNFDQFIQETTNNPYPEYAFPFLDNSPPALCREEEAIGHLATRFQELINRQIFWLPHEDRRNPSAIETQDQILGPLMRKEPLTTALLHGILYRILPDVFDIVEYVSHLELQSDLGRLTSPSSDRTVVIVSDTRPELVLVDTCKKKLTYVTSLEMTEIGSAVILPADWKVQLHNPIAVDSSIEFTLLSIQLVEAECKANQSTLPYAEVHLRLRYFEALLVREQRQSEYFTSLRAEKYPARLAEPDMTASSPITTASAELHIDELDPTLLKEALSRKPKNLKDVKCLRILQYIHGTGGPQVLDQLKITVMSLEHHMDMVVQDSREEHAARISAIHTALDSRGSTSHFGIVQSRFARLSYYREFQYAVESLRSSNKARRVERQKLARHQQRLGHVAENEQTLLTPQTIAMAQQYSETTGRSSSIVRDDVVRRLSVIYKRPSPGDQAEIKSQVDSYIRQGKILHLVLQGCSCDASPAVLLLIPTIAVTPLDVTACVPDESSKQKLRKRFKPNEIDDLSETEAQWMGEALKILRPEILKEPPNNALNLLKDSLIEVEDVTSRDSREFVTDPFEFFASLAKRTFVKASQRSIRY